MTDLLENWCQVVAYLKVDSIIVGKQGIPLKVVLLQAKVYDLPIEKLDVSEEEEEEEEEDASNIFGE